MFTQDLAVCLQTPGWGPKAWDTVPWRTGNQRFPHPLSIQHCWTAISRRPSSPSTYAPEGQEWKRGSGGGTEQARASDSPCSCLESQMQKSSRCPHPDRSLSTGNGMQTGEGPTQDQGEPQIRSWGLSREGGAKERTMPLQRALHVLPKVEQ